MFTKIYIYTLCNKNLFCVFPVIRFAMFHNVRIPRENLLNNTGDVTADGNYVTPFKVGGTTHAS